MSPKGDATPPQRRRGAALEEALLDAAWAELEDKGYDAFTIDAVADRAHTSRAVLYRRWATKPDLVRAAIGHNGFRDRVEPADTGSLRGDLLATFQELNKVRLPFAILVSTRLGGFQADTGTSLADLRQDFLQERARTLDVMYDRAVERGEIDATKLTPRVRELAADLYRHEVLMTQRAVPNQVLESIIDEIVLPLMRRS